MNSQELVGNGNYPTSIIAGAGAVAQLDDCCQQLEMARPLLVTDPALAALPLVPQALETCRNAGLDVGLFSNIKGNPSGQNVLDGVVAFRDGGHDGIIAFGGGSAIDAAKAIALMVGQRRPLWDFADLDDNWMLADSDGIATIIAVPTTAGTGSEVGRAALITDEDSRVKRIVWHPRLLPTRVILDPMLTVGLPPGITAATGMDALSHNLEALCSPAYHPRAEGIAIEGMRLVSENLPAAVENGHDITARMHMITASSMGATAFQKGLGAMHALAHPLGALYDAHHGLLNAVLMPYVLQANRSAVSAKLERAARYMNLQNPGFDSFLEWVLRLRERIAIPHTLRDLGIDDGQRGLVAQMAVVDPTAATNPIALNAEQFGELFSRAVKGEL